MCPPSSLALCCQEAEPSPPLLVCGLNLPPHFDGVEVAASEIPLEKASWLFPVVLEPPGLGNASWHVWEDTWDPL